MAMVLRCVLVVIGLIACVHCETSFRSVSAAMEDPLPTTEPPPAPAPLRSNLSSRRIPSLTSLVRVRPSLVSQENPAPILLPRKISRAPAPSVPALTPRKISPVPVHNSQEVIIFDSRKIPSVEPEREPISRKTPILTHSNSTQGHSSHENPFTSNPSLTVSRKTSSSGGSRKIVTPVSSVQDAPTLSVLRIRPVPSAILRDRSASSALLRNRTSPSVLSPSEVSVLPISLSSPIIIKRPSPTPATSLMPKRLHPTPSIPRLIKRPTTPPPTVFIRIPKTNEPSSTTEPPSAPSSKIVKSSNVTVLRPQIRPVIFPSLLKRPQIYQSDSVSLEKSNPSVLHLNESYTTPPPSADNTTTSPPEDPVTSLPPPDPEEEPVVSTLSPDAEEELESPGVVGRLSSATMPLLTSARRPRPSPLPASGQRPSQSLPRNRFLISLKQKQDEKEDNLIGKSPCPRGREGRTCRQRLAVSSFNCTDGSCRKCRSGCSSLSPSEWTGCCRDHLLCCRHLASACLHCNHPQLFPFCSAAFNKCK